MKKHIELAKSISDKPDANYKDDLKHHNLHVIFEPIYKLQVTTRTCNIITAFIILAYDMDSSWIDIKKDRYENKVKILKSLDTDPSSELFSSILSKEHDIVNHVIVEYLIDQTDWRWQSVMSLFDYHSNMIRYVNQKTATEKSYDKADKEGNVQNFSEDYDQDKIVKVNKDKSDLLKRAVEARKEGEEILSKMKKDFVALDDAVQKDFGFQMTDEKKLDTSKWRDFIKHVVIPSKASKKPLS